MLPASERKVVLVTRRTRLEELLARHHTREQARFYVEHLGADFGDYQREHETYLSAQRQLVELLHAHGRYQVLERRFTPNFLFGPEDVVIALGQDGLVANTLKYLDGQPLIGVNPDPKRWDGVLLPFAPSDLAQVLPAVLAGQAARRAVTMAQARLANGQSLHAVNDLFVGPKSHTSARYEIEVGGSAGGAVVERGDRLDGPRVHRLDAERGHRWARGGVVCDGLADGIRVPGAGVGGRRTRVRGARAVSEPLVAGDAAVRSHRGGRAAGDDVADGGGRGDLQ